MVVPNSNKSIALLFFTFPIIQHSIFTTDKKNILISLNNKCKLSHLLSSLGEYC